MKKTFLFVILAVFAGNFLIAQPGCVKDVIYALVSQNEVVRARKIMEEQCFPGNQSSADVWLVRANVFIRLHQYELDRKQKDAKYQIRWPDAIVTANESFYKALELRSDVRTPQGLLSPQDGQVLSAFPISELAGKAMDKKNYAEAIRLLNLVIRSYRVDPKAYAQYLGYAYLDLANSYRAMGDEENYKKFLLDAAKLNVPERNIYLQLYNLYEREHDTVKCGEVLAQARKILPNDLEIRGYELNYFAMLGDTAHLRMAAMAIFEQTKTNPVGIAFVVEYMIDNKEYLLAEEMIETGIAIAPDNFDLNLQMTYRYFYEAEDYERIRADRMNERPRNIEGAKLAEARRDELWGQGIIWAEKAYNINPNDMKLNKMYNYMLLRLNKEVPEDLKERIDSYNKQ